MTLVDALKNQYVRGWPVEATRALERLPDKSLGNELDGLDSASLLAALDRLPPASAARLFKSLEPSRQLGVLHAAPPRLAITLLTSANEDHRRELLTALPDGISADLERLLQFPENTAGRLMDRSFDTVRDDMTVGEALARIRDTDVRRARSIYVVDANNRLAGRVAMQDLALADNSEPLRRYLEPVEAQMEAMSPREEIVALLDKHRSDSVPVIDGEGRLLGVVRYRSLFNSIEAVASADMAKMVGASADERALSAPGFSVKRRLPWLHINLLTAFLAAAVVGLFENLIAQFTALAVLLPVVAGQSGNAGSQALAVTIRGLALKEIGTREWKRVLNKEILVGLLNGVALAITCGIAVYFWSDSFGLTVVIAIAMLLSMLAAGIAGALVPIILTRVGQDPATASSIILTTVTDVAGFFSFLGTATALSTML